MDLWNYLKTTNKPIVLYGMGNGADRILNILEAMSVSVSGVFASDGFVRHQHFRGFTVCSYYELKERFKEMIVLVAFGTQRPEVIENIRKIATEQELYAPDVPVIGDLLFDSQYVKDYQNELKTVYEMLSDDQSKKVFESVIKAKLTGNIQYLFDCESDPQEAFSYLKLSDHEVYMDLGAYNGDTVQEFLGVTDNRYQQIYAVEPDFKNYKKLLNNTESLINIKCYNACIGAESGQLPFAMDGGRKSKALQDDGTMIPCKTIDEILDGGPVSYIKFDVEGMEAAALLGGKESIKRWKPKMLVSAYHRSEDLFHLPLLVQKICPGAKVYLRHYPYVPAWDTNFYFVYE